MIQFQENARRDGRTEERRKDEQALIYRTLPGTAGDPTSVYIGRINT